jgi:4-cresol dehydrogenase (hydroxylating)
MIHTQADAGRHATRDVAGTVRPASLQEVVELVREAAVDGVPLYPISTGGNWGMGSRSPVVDGCRVLDLGGLRAIRSLDVEHGVAVIEPGVTQRQLAAALEGTDWLLNVTASCADTSVIGNALERGDGTIRSRVEDTLGVEAVLADGSIIETGGLHAGRYRGRVAGPDLTQAFVQSNLGVVTAMAVSLIPRPERIRLVRARLHEDALGPAVTAIAGLLREGLPAGGLVRIRELFLAPTGGAFPQPRGAETGQFVVSGPLLGSAAAVELAESMLRDRLGTLPGFMGLRSIDAVDAAADEPQRARALMAGGTPTCAPLHASLGIDSCERIDGGPTGFLAMMPLIPFDRESALAMVAILRAAVEAHRTALMAEWNLVSPHVANGVVQILFDGERPGAAADAHALRAAAREGFLERGFLPYRSDIDHVAAELDAQAAAGREALTTIKTALDPDGVLAPGRFLTTRNGMHHER